MSRSSSARVHFVDVLRLLALVQMVNGHTLHALLDDSVRHGARYQAYLWFRGLVSVAFMVVAGLSYYLTTLARWDAHQRDPAARRRRLLRALEIIAIGMLLRFPVQSVLTLDLHGLERGLFGLARIDVLPCIGVSLLVLEGISRLCRTPLQVVSVCAALVVVMAALTPWGATLPAQGAIGLLTGWLGPQGGSPFPLLPFAGYVLSGVVLGAVALPEGAATRARSVSLRLLLTAAGLGVASWSAAKLAFGAHGGYAVNVHTPSFFLQKLAVVTLALSALSAALHRLRALPRPLRTLSGETLAIYVFHLLVLYGAPIALARRVGSTLPLSAALSVSAAMLCASTLVGLGWHSIKEAPRTRSFVPSSRLVIISTALALGCALLVFSSRSLAASTPAQGSRIRSVALTVDALPAAARFFVDGLGFRTQGGVRELRGPEISGLYGLSAAAARSQRLQIGDETIELLVFSTPSGRATPNDSHSDDLWFQHLALVSSDIDATQRRLAEQHAEPISSAIQTIPRSNPAAGGIRAYYFRGPAQHPLELIWFPIGKGMPRWQSKAAPVLGIDHTAIAVSDTERSLRFYAGLLGLRVAGHSLNFGREQAALSGVPGARVRITGLRGEQGPGVEFLQYLAPRRGRTLPVASRASDLWHWETTISVPDLDRTVAQLRAAHVRFVSDAVHDTRQFGDSSRGVLVLDPDGHAVRVIQ